MDATMRTSTARALSSTDLGRPAAVAAEQTVETTPAVATQVTSARARDNARLAAREMVDAIRSLRAETRPVLPSVLALAPDAERPDVAVEGASATDVQQSVDKSGLLAALGLAAGAVHSSRGSTSVHLTGKGVETVTNAGSVSVRVAAAIGKLNAALAQVAQLRTMSPETNQQVEAAIRAALALIASAGVQGITATSNGDRMQIDVSRGKLTDSLAKLAERTADSVPTDLAVAGSLAEDDAESLKSIVARALTQFATSQPGSRPALGDPAYVSRSHGAKIYIDAESGLAGVDQMEYRQPDE